MNRNKSVKTGAIALAVMGAALALGACAGDGYSPTSVGFGMSAYDPGYYGSRRDWDGDGIPNRYDMDRDGDGVSNRFDWSPSNPYRR
jgi:hypothetical protein